MTEPNKITESDLKIEDAITSLIVEHGVEPVLKAIARVCRMGAELNNNSGDYGRAGDYDHYACTIESLWRG